MIKKMKKNNLIFETLFLFIILLTFTVSIHSEEYSIRRKKPAPVPKKTQNSAKKETETTPQFGYSRENNKLANQFWLEESAIFNPEYLDGLKTTDEVVEAPIEKVDPQKLEASNPKPKEDEIQTNKAEKPKTVQTGQPNPVVQFLSENKKILLIISLLIIFAIYRLRGDTSSRTNQNTRIFSKFRNK